MKILDLNFQRDQTLSVLASNRMTRVWLSTLLVTAEKSWVSVQLLLSCGHLTQPGAETGDHQRSFSTLTTVKYIFFLDQEGFSTLSMQFLGGVYFILI